MNNKINILLIYKSIIKLYNINKHHNAQKEKNKLIKFIKFLLKLLTKQKVFDIIGMQT